MMSLNHLNLPVRDLAKARSLFTTYFGFQTIAESERPHLVILKDENGFVLVLSRFTEEAPVYPKGFHVGFYQEDQAKVWEMHRRLREGGYVLPQEPGPVHVSFGFYFDVLDGVLIEVSVQV